MKNLITIAITALVFSSHSNASCLQKYMHSIKTPKVASYIKYEFRRPHGSTFADSTVTVSSIIGITGWATLGFLPGAAGFLILPAAVVTTIGVETGVVALQNIKENKMIDLIIQSRDYVQKGGIPGKRLKKLHTQINKSANVELRDLAEMIVRTDEDQSLCANDLASLREVSRAVENGELQILELE